MPLICVGAATEAPLLNPNRAFEVAEGSLPGPEAALNTNQRYYNGSGDCATATPVSSRQLNNLVRIIRRAAELADVCEPVDGDIDFLYDIMAAIAQDFVTTAIAPTKYLEVNNIVASGVDGQTIPAATWTTRNASPGSNTIAGASVVADKITLPAGSYRVDGAMVASGFLNPTMAGRLYDALNVQVVGNFVTQIYDSPGDLPRATQVSLAIHQVLVLANETSFYAQTYISNPNAPGGGSAGDIPDTPNVYLSLIFQKLNQ
jgi:hypothetical protein